MFCLFGWSVVTLLCLLLGEPLVREGVSKNISQFSTGLPRSVTEGQGKVDFIQSQGILLKVAASYSIRCFRITRQFRFKNYLSHDCLCLFRHCQ